MSLDKIIEKNKQERHAEGIFNNHKLVVYLDKIVSCRWRIFITLYDVGHDEKLFWRKKSADKWFDSLVSKYNLRED